MLQSVKMAYLWYNADPAGKGRLLEQAMKVAKQNKVQDTKHRETEDERNMIIVTIQQERINTILLNTWSTLYWYFSIF